MRLGLQNKKISQLLDGLKRILLGLLTFNTLNLVIRIDMLTDIPVEVILKQFPSLFQSIGNLGEK